MEFRPNWKIRWFSIAVLMLPTLALIAYSLRYPAVHAKGKEGVFAYLEDKPAASAPSGLTWTVQDSGTAASLRGIYSLDGKVAWASGTEGTVLRTVDGGAHWAKCTVPDEATDGATLDFRGVQAWDAQTAIVMASGLGDKSRLYKTVDGCGSWAELARNRDKDGFWDSLHRAYLDDGTHLLLLGDPVGGHFFVRRVNASTGELQSFGESSGDSALIAAEEAGAFAASNSSLTLAGVGIARVSRLRPAKTDISIVFGTGGISGAAVYRAQADDRASKESEEMNWSRWERISVPMAGANASSGIFSIASHSGASLVAVGGDYEKPNETVGTAALSKDEGKTWIAAAKPPHGYRSSVAWSEGLKAWIAAGTSGSDVSRDEGKTWTALDDGNWNALSLPFVVGPKGRIARLSTLEKK
jgi:photosystem II stability/assembly factor-like uncharacterized protein